MFEYLVEKAIVLKKYWMIPQVLSRPFEELRTFEMLVMVWIIRFPTKLAFVREEGGKGAGYIGRIFLPRLF